MNHEVAGREVHVSFSTVRTPSKNVLSGRVNTLSQTPSFSYVYTYIVPQLHVLTTGVRPALQCHLIRVTVY